MISKRDKTYLNRVRVQVVILLVPFLYTLPTGASACLFSVESNDDFANVIADGQPLGAVPQKLPCKDRTIKLTVQSRGGQTFSRTLPARSHFDSTLHGQWNVIFSERDKLHTSANSVIIQSPISSLKTPGLLQNQKRIIDELDRVKSRLSFIESNGTPPMGVNRMPSSTPHSQSQKRLQGHYVQLHSFQGSKWDLSEISGEINQANPASGNHRLQFCLNQKALNNTWTRVYWGPFKNRQAAKAAANKIDRQTVLVSNPNCQIF